MPSTTQMRHRPQRRNVMTGILLGATLLAGLIPVHLAASDDDPNSATRNCLRGGTQDELQRRLSILCNTAESGIVQKIRRDNEWWLLEQRWISFELCNWLSAGDPRQSTDGGDTLFMMLGVFKDANTARFMRCYFSEHAFYGLSAWLLGWERHHYFCWNQGEWEVRRATWLTYFRWLLGQPLPDEETRARVVAVMDDWFFDDTVTQALLRLRTRGAPSPATRANVEVALWRRGLADTARLDEALTALQKEDARGVLDIAPRAYVRECVPGLIALLDDRFDDMTAAIANSYLRRLTYRSQPPEGWAAWWEKSKSQTREDWLAERVRELQPAIDAGRWDEVEHFIAMHCSGDDPVAVAWIASLAKYPELSEAVLAKLPPTFCPRLRELAAPALETLRRRTCDDDALYRAWRDRQAGVSWENSLDELLQPNGFGCRPSDTRVTIGFAGE